ncbi:MAG: RNA polymerase sporulation sigma factor SigG [Firmicutes bacterium]|nr:RNA polymerase sporulation sigma factor SigG [Bacillota bacterium]
MARHKVEISGVNTSNIKVLSSEEMEELFIKMKNGDPFARDDLVNGNLKLVLSILRKFASKVDNLDDLFQIGCVGLLKAIDNFDLSYGVKFSTYSVPMILGEIKRYIRDNSSIRVSRSVKDIAYKALKLKDELTVQNGKEPRIEELATTLNVTPFEIINALDALKDPVSMFEPIYNDGGDTIYLFDQLEDSSNNVDLDLKISINNAMKQLKPREKDIINERFIIGKTQMEISEELGISQAQVSRIEKSALDKVKRLIK